MGINFILTSTFHQSALGVKVLIGDRGKSYLTCFSINVQCQNAVVCMRIQNNISWYNKLFKCIAQQTRMDKNGLKFFSIRMRILNNEYFFGFNWIQLDSIGCNWIEKLHFLFKILNGTLFTMCVLCIEKANIIFRLKGIEIYSMQ